MKIAMIAAMAHNRVIGLNNQMPWHMPDDLKHFKQVTMGKPVVMGRKTYESIGRALPGRLNVVITRQADYTLADATVVPSLDAALSCAQQHVDDNAEVMIIGGGAIYNAMLPHADVLYLTFIDAEVEGDTFFPDYAGAADWQVEELGSHHADDRNQYPCRFVRLHKR